MEKTRTTLFHRKEPNLIHTITSIPTTTLFHATSCFPFDFFPDEIIVDMTKVTIIYRSFFLSAKSVSIPIATINNCTCSTSVMYGSISLEVIGEFKQPAPIEFLRKQDAIRAEHLINGLIISYRNGIDLSQYSVADISGSLEQLGTA